ncbi:MAG: hypothetical protein KatS3mg111_1430 [Pirellulaceae bacterium]|nr:MAG: hypothetical protein KatS3mg111_1430 [Pirellulaceae bacterium]
MADRNDQHSCGRHQNENVPVWRRLPRFDAKAVAEVTCGRDGGAQIVDQPSRTQITIGLPSILRTITHCPECINQWVACIPIKAPTVGA